MENINISQTAIPAGVGAAVAALKVAATGAGAQARAVARALLPGYDDPVAYAGVTPDDVRAMLADVEGARSETLAAFPKIENRGGRGKVNTIEAKAASADRKVARERINDTADHAVALISGGPAADRLEGKIARAIGKAIRKGEATDYAAAFATVETEWIAKENARIEKRIAAASAGKPVTVDEAAKIAADQEAASTESAKPDHYGTAVGALQTLAAVHDGARHALSGEQCETLINMLRAAGDLWQAHADARGNVADATPDTGADGQPDTGASRKRNRKVA